MSKLIDEQMHRLRSAMDKELSISQNLFLMNMIQLDKKSIRAFLDSQGMSCIGVYGLGKVGRVFVELLAREGVKVRYVVDKDLNAQAEFYTTIHSVLDMTDDIDAMIITSDFYFDEIKEEILAHRDVQIVLLHDMLESIATIPISV